MFGKSINRKVLHEQFEELLKSIQPKEDLVQLLEKTVFEGYEDNKVDETKYKKVLQSEISQIDGRITKYINRI